MHRLYVSTEWSLREKDRERENMRESSDFSGNIHQDLLEAVYIYNTLDDGASFV